MQKQTCFGTLSLLLTAVLGSLSFQPGGCQAKDAFGIVAGTKTPAAASSLATTLVSHTTNTDFDEQFEHWPLKLKIRGTVVVAHRLEMTAELAAQLTRSREEQTALAILAKEVDEEKFKQAFAGLENVTLTTARLGTLKDKKTKEQMQKARLLFIIGSDNASKEDVTLLRNAGAEIHNLVDRGGMVYLQGGLASLAGARRLNDEKGLGLFFDSVIELCEEGSVDERRLRSHLVQNPRTIGLRVFPKTAVALSGRLMQVLGPGKAKAVLTANDREPFLTKELKQRSSLRQNRQTYMLDLTQWRRIAMDRDLPEFPPKTPPKPFVENGTLVIVGGGGMPRGLMSRIVELAGGKDKAKMVYVPCSERDSLSSPQRTVQGWTRMGVANATFIHTKDRNKANKDESILGPLRDATGLWFGGGRQWNFADSYYGTEAHKLMKEVLKRGGVIGGSSAGASIQGRYLARATPINNFDIMAPGYERGGLGFLGGVAIDQHFSQRGRQKDMTTLVDKYPQLLGIGLDEATAIIVQKSVAEVVGRGKAHFYDRTQPVYPDQPDYIALPAGSKYELAERKVLVDTRKKQDTEDESKEKEKAATDK